MANKKCACCGGETLDPAVTSHGVCPVCGWEDDPVQNDDPAFWGGANDLSLNLSREIWSWKRRGTCPLCGRKTLRGNGRQERCEVCGWIDDPAQNDGGVEGANPMTLEYARLAWYRAQPFGLLSGKGWDETRNHDGPALHLEAGAALPLRPRVCPCCGEASLLTRHQREVCEVCGWIDDGYQDTHPDSREGPNAVTLNEARGAYFDGGLDERGSESGVFPSPVPEPAYAAGD